MANVWVVLVVVVAVVLVAEVLIVVGEHRQTQVAAALATAAHASMVAVTGADPATVGERVALASSVRRSACPFARGCNSTSSAASPATCAAA